MVDLPDLPPMEEQANKGLIGGLADFFAQFFWGAVIYSRQRVHLVSAAVTFYSLLSLFPLILLVQAVLGGILNDHFFVLGKTIEMVKTLLPNLSSWALDTIKELALHGGDLGKQNYLSYLILAFGTLSVFRASVSGITIITNYQQPHSGLKVYLRSTIGLLLTMILIFLLMVTTPLTMFMLKFAQNNIVTNFLLNYLPAGTNFFSSIVGKMSSLGESRYLLKQNLIHGVLILVYLTVLYRLLFTKKIGLKKAFSGALAFVALFLAGKNLYFIYIFHARDNLIKNYGDFYTLIITILWSYFVMSSFFYGACVTYSSDYDFKITGERF